VRNNGNNFSWRNKNNAILAEINITPLVDVMLVLLIVFMVTSPMLVAGINIELPETKASPVSSKEEPLVVSIDKKGKLYLMDVPIEKKELVAKLKAIYANKKNNKLFIRGDENANYGVIMQIMGEANAAGFTKISLISKIKD